jgi:energy-coupling factor transport system permease protein
MPVVQATLADSELGRFNPSAKLAVAVVVMLGLLVTVDLVSASILLGSEVLCIVLAGVRFRPLLARVWPLPIAAGGVAIANMLASNANGATTAAISLRLMAIALPGLLLFVSTDAVDLADSLVQQLHVPARFAYGSLAALRLLPLLSDEWVTIHRARRARGIDAGHSPIKLAQLFASAVFALLIGAIRRGTRLALAMDSRGFDSHAPRTIARLQEVHVADQVLMVGAIVLVISANVLAMVVGVWHPLLG